MEEGNPKSQQGSLILKLKNMIPAHLSLVDELSDLLEISSDSAYRRIRGEKALSIDEVIKICEHFRISFDSLMSHEQGIVCFNYVSVRNYEDFQAFLEDIQKDMERIINVPEHHITYAAVDVPLFHLFINPEYFYFKMFYWLRSVVNDPDFSERKFCLSEMKDEIVSHCKRLTDQYASIPSTEVWCDSVLNSIIKQIEYYWLSGVFNSREDALFLIEKVKSTLESIQRGAELNGKFKSDGHLNLAKNLYTLYHSDIEIGSNTILVNISDTKRVYNSFHTFNKMFTMNTEYCDLTTVWMDTLMRQASPISGVAEKHRFQFFNYIFKKLDSLRDEISKD